MWNLMEIWPNFKCCRRFWRVTDPLCCCVCGRWVISNPVTNDFISDYKSQLIQTQLLPLRFKWCNVFIKSLKTTTMVTTSIISLNLELETHILINSSKPDQLISPVITSILIAYREFGIYYLLSISMTIQQESRVNCQSIYGSTFWKISTQPLRVVFHFYVLVFTVLKLQKPLILTNYSSYYKFIVINVHCM